ncbi:hypothetical protein NVI2019_PEGOAJLN_03851 (plasmid) [Providencia alcalifaciens]|nr:hypothetical protein NVI2019_PEGOAJLN_03851 [Providencia alcalifaciens]
MGNYSTTGGMQETLFKGKNACELPISHKKIKRSCMTIGYRVKYHHDYICNFHITVIKGLKEMFNIIIFFDWSGYPPLR